MRPSKCVYYMSLIAPTIKDYGATACFLDVHSSQGTATPYVDHDANVSGASKLISTINGWCALFDYAHQIYNGPVLGEGIYHIYWAGNVDGVEGELLAGWFPALFRGKYVPPIVDFDLKKIHTKMVNYGVGYYGRFFPDTTDTSRIREYWWPKEDLIKRENEYRAWEILFGRAGFISDNYILSGEYERFLPLPILFREYYLMWPLAKEYYSGEVNEIKYNGYDISYAIKNNIPLEKIYIKYDNGLELYVNLGATTWNVAGHTLPQYGWLARNSYTECFYSFSGKISDKLVDYSEYWSLDDSIGYITACSRTEELISIGYYITTDGLVSIKHKWEQNVKEIHMIHTQNVNYEYAPYGLINTSLRL